MAKRKSASRPKPQSQSMSRAERREQTRQELEALFLREGFRDLTVASIAKRLKCSNRSLYDIAPSKEEMFLVVLNQWLERIRHLGWQAALAHTDSIERIEAFLKPGVTETRGASAAFIEDVRSYLPAKQILARHQEERMEVLGDIIESGIKQGSFRKLHSYLVAEFLLSAATKIDELDFQSKAGLSFSDAFEELYELLLHGLLKD
ncbi:MAG: TetR/AcrR family transcriptional regulator [Gammaproteobacteria bacterium]|jgi:AcrR family transcriptional regulator|nr:TetR/AcrR family transcriptional regulator [Gammaproteobacteria bacterium]